jgi:hypothetical protein
MAHLSIVDRSDRHNLYDNLRAALKDGKPCKSIGHNTIIHPTSDGGIAIRLHYTDVVTVYENRLVLRTGGWWTPTTTNRMNQVLRLFDMAVRSKDYSLSLYLTRPTYQRVATLSEGMEISFDYAEDRAPAVVIRSIAA